MWVIIMLLANTLGQPVATGLATPEFASLELCEAARQAVVEEVQKQVDIDRPGFKISDSKCITKEAYNKVDERVQHALQENHDMQFNRKAI